MPIRKVWPKSLKRTIPNQPKSQVNQVATILLSSDYYSEHIRIAIDLDEGEWYVEDPWRAGKWHWWNKDTALLFNPQPTPKYFSKLYWNITGNHYMENNYSLPRVEVKYVSLWK